MGGLSPPKFQFSTSVEKNEQESSSSICKRTAIVELLAGRAVAKKMINDCPQMALGVAKHCPAIGGPGARGAGRVCTLVCKGEACASEN